MGRSIAFIVCIAFLMWTKFFTCVIGTVSASECLGTSKTKNVSIGGVSMPLKIALPSWYSAALIAKMVDYVLRVAATRDGRRMGYATELVDKVSTSVEAWHLLADCYSMDIGETCMAGPLGSGAHLAFEIWHTYSSGMHDKLTAEVPNRVPIRVGYPLGMGADGMEYMFMRGATVDEAKSKGYFLQWYETWNDAEVLLYFDNHTSILAPDAYDSYYLQGANVETYVNATGDSDCCTFDNGTRKWKLQNRWALSPTCRKLFAQGRPCIPLISYIGWGFPCFLQFAYFFEMPIAFGAYSWSNYADIPRRHNALLYWWVPDDTFNDSETTNEVYFPSYNPDDHAQGIYRTQSSGGKLWKMAHANIPVDEPIIYQFMERFSLSLQSIMGLVRMGKANRMTDDEVVCKWLSENRDIWEPWIPARKACILSQGLVDDMGRFVREIYNASECKFCPSGRRSVGIDTSSGASFACAQCEKGSFAESSGMTTCTFCAEGRSAVSGATYCQSCPAGKFQQHTGRSACEDCPVLETTGQDGATSSDACRCVSGMYYGQSGTCTCPAGKFASIISESTEVVTCMPCEQYHYANEGSFTCSHCDGGDFSVLWNSQCFPYCQRVILLFLVLMQLGYTCRVACGAPIPIKDISIERNRLVATSTVVHHAPPWVSSHVRLHGTGHVGLDSPKTALSAKRLTADCISLHMYQQKSSLKDQASSAHGPAGTRSLSRGLSDLARRAETRDTRDYEEWATYITEARIGWVKVRYLRELANVGGFIPRRQDVPDDQIEVGSFGDYENDCVRVHRWVTSHPWCSTRHPDPEGRQLKWIVGELDRLGARESDLVFYDFMSIYQHDFSDESLWQIHCTRSQQRGDGVPDAELVAWPAPGQHPAVRSVEEQRLFEMGLNRSELLYSFYGSRVIVAPEPPCAFEVEREIIPGYPAYTRLYMHRGWCFLEISVSKLFHTVANDDSPLVQAAYKKLPQNPAEFERMFFRTVRFSFAGDADAVCEMFSRLYHASPKGTAARQLLVGFEGVESMYASTGTIRILFPYTLLSPMFYVVPCFVLVLLLPIVAAALILSGSLSRRTVCTELVLAALLTWIVYAFTLWSGFTCTPLAKRRAQFQRTIRERHRKPSGYDAGPGRGLALGHLRDVQEFLADFIGCRDMKYVRTNIIMPLTKRPQLSYAELVGPMSHEKVWFTSYSLRQPFSDIVVSVINHAKARAPKGFAWRRARYWIEDVSTNFWTGESDLGCWDSHSLKVLHSASCMGTIVVVDSNVLPCTSTRCAFEIVESFKIKTSKPEIADSHNTVTSCVSDFKISFCSPFDVHGGGSACSVALSIAAAVGNISAGFSDASDDECSQHVIDNSEFLKRSIGELLVSTTLSSFEYYRERLVKVLDIDIDQLANEPEPLVASRSAKTLTHL